MSARTSAAGALIVLTAFLAAIAAQPPPPRPGTPLTLLSREGRRALPVTLTGGIEMVSLTDLATAFQLSVHEDQLAGGLTVTFRSQSIALTAGQTLVSVAGRLVSLPAAPVRDGRSWLVPVEFINRALAPIFGARLELRKDSHLVIVGDLRVPRVVISHEMLGAQSRVAIDITPRVATRIVQETGRIVATLDADTIDAQIAPPRPGSLVAAVQLSEPSSILIGLAPGFGTYRATELATATGVRYLLDLLPAGTETTETARAPDPPPTAPPIALDTGSPGIRTIVIDPGHGGSDTGAKGAGGTLEKTITLSVARRLKATIESRLGLRALLTRDADEDTRMDERAAVANNNKADLFLSLHVNTSFRPTLVGAEVYYLSLEQYGEEARRLAVEPGDVLPVFGGGMRSIDVVPWDMAQARHLDRAAQLAATIDEELRQRVPMIPRGIQPGPMRVLVGANMPAALIEMGFISNPAQERELRSEEYQNRIVLSLYAAIGRFRNMPPPDPADRPAPVEDR